MSSKYVSVRLQLDMLQYAFPFKVQYFGINQNRTAVFNYFVFIFNPQRIALVVGWGGTVSCIILRYFAQELLSVFLSSFMINSPGEERADHLAGCGF